MPWTMFLGMMSRRGASIRTISSAECSSANDPSFGESSTTTFGRTVGHGPVTSGAAWLTILSRLSYS